MTKNDIALNTNHVEKNLTRIIYVDDAVEFISNFKLDEDGDIIEGQYFDNMGNPSSWMCSNCSFEFQVENPQGDKVVLHIRDEAPCHKVDYDNEEECESLGASDCESEGEVLLHKDVKLKIIDIPGDVKEDLECTGYIDIILRYES